MLSNRGLELIHQDFLQATPLHGAGLYSNLKKGFSKAAKLSQSSAAQQLLNSVVKASGSTVAKQVLDASNTATGQKLISAIAASGSGHSRLEESRINPIGGLKKTRKKTKKIVMEGAGIFGKHGDKVLKKAGVKKLAYKVGDVAKPYAKQALQASLAALVASNPELAPVAVIANSVGDDFLDHPSNYQGSGRKSLKKTKKVVSIKQPNQWVMHVKDFCARHACSYKEALQLAKSSYHK